MRIDDLKAIDRDLRMTADEWVAMYRAGWKPSGRVKMSQAEYDKLKLTYEHRDFCRRHGVQDTTQPVVVAKPLMDIEAAIARIDSTPPLDTYPDTARSLGLADTMPDAGKPRDITPEPKRFEFSPNQTIGDCSKSSANDTQVGGSHYKDMKVQPWDALEAWMTREEFCGFLKGSAIAYLARASTKGVEGKGGTVDILKAKHYIVKLESILEKG